MPLPAWVPVQLMKKPRAGELVRLLEEFELPPTGIHIVYPSGATALPKLEVFVAEIGAALKSRLALGRSRSLRPG